MSTEGLAQDRLVRKEVSLGTIREYEPPQDHIGLRLIAPWMEVQSDDVTFSYVKGMTADMVPARAEDAEAELAGKDYFSGTGRAAINDWAVKHHYDASDVTRYREGLIIRESPIADTLPLTAGSMTEDFARKLARDEAFRRRKIDNRLEWLIMTGLDTGQIVYDDGKVAFTTDWGRPADQQDMAPGSGLWSNSASDPIDDIMSIQQDAKDNNGVDITRCIISKEIARNIYKNDKFYVSGTTSAQRLYNEAGWGPQAALDFISNQTGVEFIVYDSVYRTRPKGSQTITNNYFVRSSSAIFLPSAASMAELESDVGFAATLTSPHPEGNWTPGYYEWEQETKDPWGTDRGSGIKAFPVMPHLDLTYVMKVL